MTAEETLQKIVGSYVMQIAMLTAEVERLGKENDRLKQGLEKPRE